MTKGTVARTITYHIGMASFKLVNIITSIVQNAIVSGSLDASFLSI